MCAEADAVRSLFLTLSADARLVASWDRIGGCRLRVRIRMRELTRSELCFRHLGYDEQHHEHDQAQGPSPHAPPPAAPAGLAAPDDAAAFQSYRGVSCGDERAVDRHTYRLGS
jgi:hypothetical protein